MNSVLSEQPDDDLQPLFSATARDAASPDRAALAALREPRRVSSPCIAVTNGRGAAWQEGRPL